VPHLIAQASFQEFTASMVAELENLNLDEARRLIALNGRTANLGYYKLKV
jgi:hypothetical protein